MNPAWILIYFLWSEDTPVLRGEMTVPKAFQVFVFFFQALPVKPGWHTNRGRVRLLGVVKAWSCPMNGAAKADVEVRRRKDGACKGIGRLRQESRVWPWRQVGARGDLAVCQEVFPSTLPREEPWSQSGFVWGKKVVRQFLRENKGVAWVVTIR